MHESTGSILPRKNRPAGSGPVILFDCLDQEKGRLYSLVLTSRHIPHALRPCTDNTVSLLVQPENGREALREIALYNQENRDFFPARKPALRHFRHLRASVTSIVLVASVMSAMFRYDVREILLSAGAADSSKIIHGEVWRTVTSLFLHADPAHFLSNIVMGGVFFVILFEETGVGLGWFLVLAGGAAGNYLNALMYGYGHVSIGLSTAVFSSIGTYCAIRAFGSGFRGVKEGFEVFLSGLALLGLLGTGSGRVDISAHMYGFICGLAAGCVTWLLKRFAPVRAPGKGLFFGALSIALAAGSWILALLHSPSVTGLADLF